MGDPMDVTKFYKDNLEELIAAAEKEKDFESNPRKKIDIGKDIAMMKADRALQIMASGLDFPGTPEDFKALLKKADDDVAKRERLAEIQDKANKIGGQILEITQRAVPFLVKYGKYLALV